MNVDRLSITVPGELGAAVRALARARGDTVSTVATEALALKVRHAALDRALADAHRRFGPVPAELVAEAESALVGAIRAGRGRKARRPRR